VGVPVAQGLDAGLDDVRRRLEIGLPDLEVDDPATGRLQGARTGEHLEGGLGAEPRHARCELQRNDPLIAGIWRPAH
jgi:hypothetical protein